MSARAKFVIVIAALRGGTAIAEPPTPLERGTVIESFAITRGTSTLLLLPMTVFRKRILAVLDTGSELTVYDKSLQSSMGNPQGLITADTPQGSRQVELFLAPSPSVGKIRLDHDSQFVVCYDLVNIRHATKRDVRALIGMDLLRRSVIRIDSELAVIDFLVDAGAIRASAIPLKGEMDGPSVVGTIVTVHGAGRSDGAG